MSKVTTTIHADKAGMIEYLTEKKDYHQEQAQPLLNAAGKETRTIRFRHYHKGIAEGLALAIFAIEDWVEADAIEPPYETVPWLEATRKEESKP